jgi:hypothetical protein
MTPFRNEKNSNWEGAYRVPAMVRWPGVIPAGRSAYRHRQPYGLAAHPAGGGWGTRHQGKAARRGYQVGNKNFKVHLDGYNQLDY